MTFCNPQMKLKSQRHHIPNLIKSGACGPVASHVHNSEGETAPVWGPSVVVTSQEPSQFFPY